MPQVANLFFKTAILFLIVGIGVGLHMATSGNHAAAPAHAHINLLGWVTSAIFGGYYALNPAKAASRLAMLHYAIYTIGVVVMTFSLYFLVTGNPAFEPVVAVASIVTAIGVLLFAWIIFMPAARPSPLMPQAAE